MTNPKPIWTETGKWKQPEWATYCEARKPAFKVHSSLGLCHSAIANKKPHVPVTLLHYEDGAWRVEWEYKIPDICESCGGPFTPDRWGRVQRYLPFSYEGKVKDAPVVCQGCSDAAREEFYREVREEQERREFERLQSIYGDKNE